MCSVFFRILVFFFYSVFFFPSHLFGQQNDYSSIDKFAKKTPDGVSRLYKPLTHYLTDRYSSDDEKIRSISVWIVNNIRYDTKMFRTDKRKKLSPNKILLKRKAICQGYCDLFEAMCLEAGIDARTIVGYDKGANYEPSDIFVRDDHAWNAVNVNGGWQLLDLTWSAGYVIPRRQTFRRILYYLFEIPFKQKYKFVKNVNYRYYFTAPDTFSIDHLPTFPWWQLSKEKSIITFEMDTSARRLVEPTNYSGPSSGAIPDIDKSDEPIAYLKKAEIAFKFNSKNYRALAEGKAMYCDRWFRLTDKSKEKENKEKVEIYDSCKTVVDEAKEATKLYIQYTSKEREVRLLKNKAYNKDALDFSKNQKHKITTETQQNYSCINAIDRQIEKLKAEKRNIKNELYFINNLKLPERNKSPENTISQAQYVNYSSTLEDSITILKSNLSIILSQNDNENFASIRKNAKNIDSLINVTCSWVYRKIVYRMFFDWNFKIAVDTLQYQHYSISKQKDSIINLKASQLSIVDKNDQQQALQSLRIRYFYRKKIKFNHSIYSSSTDSLIDALKIKDSCKAITLAWKEYNNDRLVQNDKEIQRLKKEKKSIATINRKLRVEKKYNNYEMLFEGKRYKYFNKYYFKFYRKEKKKAVRYYEMLSGLKKAIQIEDSDCKEKVREEERKEKKENKESGKTK